MWANSEGRTECRYPEQRCALCSLLWPRGHHNGVGFDLSRPPCAVMVTDWIVSGLSRAGLDPSLFSGVCARSGGYLPPSVDTHHPLDAMRTCSGGRRPTLCGAEEPQPIYMGSIRSVRANLGPSGTRRGWLTKPAKPGRVHWILTVRIS